MIIMILKKVYKSPKYSDKNPNSGVGKSEIGRQKSEKCNIGVYKNPSDEILYYKNQYLTIFAQKRGKRFLQK